ncbi:MAG: cation:proton antiporter [Acidobacteria bacterium]|nr:cation:proton antiporter [Acidobacteriota bacterium]
MILTTLVVAVALGIAAQVVSERFQVPAILLLLVLGILFGPAGVGLFAPASLGAVLEVLIHLGVAIILFEGGLSLDPDRLMQVGGPVRNLLTIGVFLTAVGATWLAHALVGMPWPAAALFGAIMTVTGPTVIVPLLRHMIAPRAVKTILMSEGLMIDPLGAVLAYLVLQWIERAGVPVRELATQVLVLAGTGVVLGFVAGVVAKVVLRTRVLGGELRNLTVLAILLLGYLISEAQAPQSGILAAVVMGLTVSASELPDLVSLRTFKGQITTLVISGLFILLAGQLDVAEMVLLGWRGLAVVAGLVFIVRPVSIGVSVLPSMLPPRGRAVLAMTAPRGIVAAAVASLAAHQLARSGIPGAAALEGLVYLTILGTGAWSTLMAVVLPHLLGFAADPARRRAVLVGGHALTERLAEMLEKEGRTTIVVDAAAWRLDRARKVGLQTVLGDARDAVTYEDAGVERDTLVIAMTTNDELNILVAELVHQEFGVEHPVVVLQSPPEEFGRRSRAWMDLLGGRGIDTPRWIRAVESGGARFVELGLADEESQAGLRQAERACPEDLVRIAARREGELSFVVNSDRFEGWEAVLLLVNSGKASEQLQAALSSETSPVVEIIGEEKP